MPGAPASSVDPASTPAVRSGAVDDADDGFTVCWTEGGLPTGSSEQAPDVVANASTSTVAFTLLRELSTRTPFVTDGLAATAEPDLALRFGRGQRISSLPKFFARDVLYVRGGGASALPWDRLRRAQEWHGIGRSPPTEASSVSAAVSGYRDKG
jgi:hypothetical protein